MYSVLLAAALTAGGVAPNWGWDCYAWGGGYAPYYASAVYYPGYGYAGYYSPVYYTPWSYYVYPYYAWPYWPTTPSTYVASYAAAPAVQPAVARTVETTGAVAHFSVRVAAGSRLYVDNVLCPQQGPEIAFDVPNLEPALTYAYTVRAVVVRAGREYEEVRRVTFRAGVPVSLNFTDLARGGPEKVVEPGVPVRPNEIVVPGPGSPREPGKAPPPPGVKPMPPEEVPPLPPKGGNKAPAGGEKPSPEGRVRPSTPPPPPPGTKAPTPGPEKEPPRDK